MTVVQSAGAIRTVEEPWGYRSRHASGAGGIGLYDGAYSDYGAIWRTQPNVRTVTGFIARNIAQLGLHVFDRVSDRDRRRITDGLAGMWLRKPTGSTKVSLYDLLEWFVLDLCVYDAAAWVKVRTDTRVGTLPVRPQHLQLIGGGLVEPDRYRLRGRASHVDFDPDQVVYVHGYNPEDLRTGVSPMETLRRILSEDEASARYREQLWLNGSKHEGIIERPLEAPAWSDPAKRRFKEDWQSRYAGGGSDVGGTPILEDGMKFHAASWSAKDAEYIAARKLSREEVAAAFHVQPATVGILEHANFANIREQHKSTYQDTLGPTLSRLERAFNLQLLEDLDLPTSAYFEFNLKEKLRGSFEEESQAIQTAVGAPHMTRNEARARQNLPPVEGGDLLVTPLNVLVGGQASPTDSGSQNVRSRRAVKALPAEATSQVEAHRLQLERLFDRQSETVVARLGAGEDLEVAFNRERWDRELATDLLAVSLASAQASGDQIAEALDVDWDVADVPGLFEALQESSAAMAAEINGRTIDVLDDAIDGSEDDATDAARSAFDDIIRASAALYATSRVTTVWNFARGVAARQGGARQKRWRTTSGNARSTHASLNGETVDIGEKFSNGAMWPGDPVLPVEERANCQCTFDVITEAP